MKRSAETVLVGDGQSLDQTGPIVSQAESGQFSMDVNFTGTGTAGNAIRHRGGSNICFADGHVQWIVLPTITRAMSNGARPAQQWESEYINAAGMPVDLTPHYASLETTGLKRNPHMPLIWSYPGKLYGP